MNCLSLPQRIGLTGARKTHSFYFTPKDVPLCQGSAIQWELRQALGMGEHLFKGGWPLLRALRLDAEMTKRRVSEMNNCGTVQFITSISVFFCSFLGVTFWSAVWISHGSRSEMDPARCRTHLSKGELVHCCRLGGPGLSIDTRLSVKLLAIQIANDRNGAWL